MRSLVLMFLLAMMAGAEYRGLLVVVEKKGAAVGFYSSDGKRVAGTATAIHPHEMIFSADRKTIYVSENGLLWMTDPGKGGNTIAVIDVASRKKVGAIDLGPNFRPHGMDLDPKTGRLVVTSENPSGLVLVDTASRKVVRRYDTKGTQPHMVLLDRAGKVAWVSNSGSKTLAALNLETGAVKLMELGENPQGGVITRDGKTIYLCVMAANKIVVIDAEKQAVKGEIATGPGPARIALTPDEKTLVYNIQMDPGVGWADVTTRKQVAVAKLPGRPLSLTMSRDGSTAWLGVQEEDKIAVVDVAGRKVLRYLNTPKGAGPDPVLPVD